jgi:hypothetical protein
MCTAQMRRQEETVNQIVGRKPSGNERQARLVPTCMHAPTCTHAPFCMQAPTCTQEVPA